MILLPIGDDIPSKRFPLVNLALVAANVAVFFSYAFSPGTLAETFILRHGLVPARFTWETLLTSMFLHGGLAHLLGNMLFLWIAGDNVEDRLGHLGYLLFYLLGGAAAGLAHAWMNPRSSMPCVGASGAISAVMAAYLVLFPLSRIRFWGAILLFWTFTFSMPALVAIGFWAAEQVLLQRMTAGDPRMTEVAYDAHLGGFALGFVSVLGMRVLGLVQGGRRGR